MCSFKKRYSVISYSPLKILRKVLMICISLVKRVLVKSAIGLYWCSFIYWCPDKNLIYMPYNFFCNFHQLVPCLQYS